MFQKNVEDTSMKMLDRDLLRTCSILREITKEQAESLKEFIKCESLVKWLQNTMTGGLKELQVFVDLASTSAGEGDMEIAKVNCLHSATTGYAPLIFNLGKECNTKDFGKCQDVWKELDLNPQLPQKLSDTERHLEWLKSVKECHGAIEVTTLSQAEAINNRVLSDVIELHVPQEEGRSSSKNKSYRYEQLHDLQSRLMLVTGKAEKGKDDVDRFMLKIDESDLSFEIEKEALKNVDTNDIERGIAGCMTNEDLLTESLCPNLTPEQADATLVTIIESLISGLLLRPRQRSPDILQCYTSGEPNLLICPQSEIYKTVVSVYSNDEDSPLPQADEVLICTLKTTLDMVQEGVDTFLFQLLVLGCHRHSSGYLWRRSEMDYYIIESMPLLDMDNSGQRQGEQLKYIHTCLDILPSVTCRTPRECLDIISIPGIKPFDFTDNDILFDNQLLASKIFRRPYMYLKKLVIDKTDKQLQTSIHQVIDILEENTIQANDVDNKTMFRNLTQDFATRSLVVSEQTPMQMLQRHEQKDNHVDIIQQYQMRRTWETRFNIERRTGNLVEHQTRTVLEQQIITPNLFDALERNKVDLDENFDSLPRCDIPVIIMGETGCGKTRLVKFMCSLQQPPNVNVENMIVMKVHGGTTPSDIIRKVQDAENIASRNTDKYPNMFTVLFFDEANTTEAIGLLKEMMCDKSLHGKPMKLHQSLKVIAACNPYRKHSDALIKRLEQAGLGYHVDAGKNFRYDWSCANEETGVSCSAITTKYASISLGLWTIERGR
ncbi:RNF213 [Mytilus edulis]|uniref:RNF213 n=1 Tax=Mytilus edulis TaxID=6550 RepID=A0A8S3S7U6_MYTED|nr:RNF213 [Mytilus edulis]